MVFQWLFAIKALCNTTLICSPELSDCRMLLNTSFWYVFLVRVFLSMTSGWHVKRTTTQGNVRKQIVSLTDLHLAASCSGSHRDHLLENFPFC